MADVKVISGITTLLEKGRNAKPLAQDIISVSKKAEQALINQQRNEIEKQILETKKSTQGVYTNFAKDAIVNPITNKVKNALKKLGEQIEKIKVGISNYFKGITDNFAAIQDVRTAKNDKLSELKAKQTALETRAKDSIRVERENAKYNTEQAKTLQSSHKKGQKYYDSLDIEKMEAEVTAKDNARITKENAKYKKEQLKKLKSAHQKGQNKYNSSSFKEMETEFTAKDNARITRENEQYKNEQSLDRAIAHINRQTYYDGIGELENIRSEKAILMKQLEALSEQEAALDANLAKGHLST